jgi:hypothetical protein
LLIPNSPRQDLTQDGYPAILCLCCGNHHVKT